MAESEAKTSASNETGKPAGRAGTGVAPSPEFTAEGAPTDKAHQEIGDSTLTGSVPAGLTADELLERAATNQPESPGNE